MTLQFPIDTLQGVGLTLEMPGGGQVGEVRRRDDQETKILGGKGGQIKTAMHQTLTNSVMKVWNISAI